MVNPAEDDPPRKHYAFKAREFERVNPPAGTVGPEAPLNVQDLNRAAAATRPSAPGIIPPATPPPENEVHAILRANAARADALGLNEIKPAESRPNRRLRDYLVIMIGGNTAIVATVAFVGLNPVTVIFGLAGMVMMSLSATWIIWFLLRKY